MVAGLVGADEQDRRAARVEGVDDSDRSSAALHAQVRMLRALDLGRIRKRQVRSLLHQEHRDCGDVLLDAVSQLLPPISEFVGVFDVPAHENIFLPWNDIKRYSVARIPWARGLARAATIASSGPFSLDWSDGRTSLLRRYAQRLAGGFEMLTLYYGRGACSIAAHIVLEESGEKYQPQRMDLAKGEQRTPEYMKIHPLGRVPALRLGS